MKVTSKMPQSIEDYDKNVTPATIGDETFHFRDVRGEPFVIDGFGWPTQNGPFRRLPPDVADAVNDGVTRVSWFCSGGAVRFRTDSPAIALRATLKEMNPLPLMPRIAKSGFDLYLGPSGSREFRKNVTYTDASGPLAEGVFARDLPSEFRECLVYMPLYDGVENMEIGIAPGATIEKPSPLSVPKPVVFHGSSITQGGCASRPGNAYPSILARWFDAHVINLGFAGSARGESIVAETIAQLEMSAFVLDYDHNAPNPERLERTHEPFFQIIRKRNPELPVIFVSRPDTHSWTKEDDARRRAVIRSTYEKAKEDGDENVYFVDGGTLFGETDRDACTVDGCHPNDLGFMRMAAGIRPILATALKRS